MKDLNVVKPETPYVGLKPFDESERGVFFGRDDDADRLVNVLFASNLTVVHALSGVGKTSLLKTLVVPTLRTMGVTTVYVDRWDRDLDQGIWLGLCRVPKAPAPEGEESLSRYVERLVRQRRDDADCDDPTLVIILDQFEEVLLRGGSAARDLMAALGELERSHLEVHVLLSMREEFLARLQSYDRYFSAVLRHTYPLGHLDEDRVRQAIVGPAEQVFDTPVEAELVAALTKDLARRADREEDAPTEIELPFMQLVCTRLWESKGDGDLTLALYESLGRRSGIITGYLQEVTGTLSDSQRDALATLVTFLAPPSGVKVSYSRRDLVSMAEELRTLPRHVDSVLDHLVKKRILSTRERDDEVLFQLYHDAFIDVLRRWAREYRTERDARQRAEAYAAEVERKNQRMRRTVWSAALIAGGMLILAAIMAVFWRDAVQAKAEAEHARRKAEKSAFAAEQAELKAEKANDTLLRKNREVEDQKDRIRDQNEDLEEYQRSTIDCLRRNDDCAQLMLGTMTNRARLQVLAVGLGQQDALPEVPDFDVSTTRSTAALGLFIRDAIDRMRDRGAHEALRPPQFDQARLALLQHLNVNFEMTLGELDEMLEREGTIGGLNHAFLRGWLLLVLRETPLAVPAFDKAPDTLHAAAARSFVRLRIAAGQRVGGSIDIELAKAGASSSSLQRALWGPRGRVAERTHRRCSRGLYGPLGSREASDRARAGRAGPASPRQRPLSAVELPPERRA